MSRNYLVPGPISPDIITSLLSVMDEKKDSGGQSLFIGRVRADKVEGRTVRAIEYSAYEGMVKAEADKIRGAVLKEFYDVKSIEIVHSTGIVKAGGISLVVAVSAGHRKHAIEACSRTVELIKEKLPVWKKEVYDDNSHSWK